MKFHEAKQNNAKNVVIRGTGKPLREFLYVDDMAEASIFLMEHYNELEFINIGTGQEVSIERLTEIIKNTVGYHGNISFDTTKPDGMMRRMIDSSRIFQMGWRPSISLEEGIKLEYQWFLENIYSEKRNIDG